MQSKSPEPIFTDPESESSNFHSISDASFTTQKPSKPPIIIMSDKEDSKIFRTPLQQFFQKLTSVLAKYNVDTKLSSFAQIHLSKISVSGTSIPLTGT